MAFFMKTKIKDVFSFLDSERGFSLIEVMITAGIVALVVSGYMASSTSLQFTNQASYERSVALQDANQVVENMRNLAAIGTFPNNVTSVYPGGTVSGFTKLTNEQVSVSYVSATANPLDVTVSVQYSENGTRTSTASLR